MAQSNKRYFNTFFFEDPYVEDLDSETKLLYLTMILNPHNNLAGCYEISISKLSIYSGLPSNIVRIGIQKLQEDRKILFSGNWLALKNFIKNNELNPNMCKNAFDVMKAAPKDKIIFIISDISGNAEPWLDEFVDKVGKGINSSIDSKNRNAIANANNKNIQIPQMIENQEFSMEIFTNNILGVQKPLNMGTVPPTLPKALGEPCGEYEGEREYNMKLNMNKEKETASFPKIPKNKLDTRINETIEYWNTKSNLPNCKYTVLNISISDLSEIKKKFDVFRDNEIPWAIDNLSEYWDMTPAKFRPRSFQGFIKNSLDGWLNDANPGSRYDSSNDNQDQLTEEDIKTIEEIQF